MVSPVKGDMRGLAMQGFECYNVPGYLAKQDILVRQRGVNIWKKEVHNC
jgi:hypothetical protein